MRGGAAATIANKKRQRLQELLNGCETKKQAFLLGIRLGRAGGWARRNAARRVSI